MIALGEEIPLEWGHQNGVPLRNRYFTAISSSSMRTVAESHRLAAYHKKRCWRSFRGYKHGWPWTTLNPPNRFLVTNWFIDIFWLLMCSLYLPFTHISNSTQPGHPCADRQNEYGRWFLPPLGKIRRVLRNSRPCYQDCWYKTYWLLTQSVEGDGC